MKYCIVVPWHDVDQRDHFLDTWKAPRRADWLVLQQDKEGEGCAVTKNKGIKEALKRKPKIVIVLDDDCYPVSNETLKDFAAAHLRAFEPQHVELYQAVTEPPSRGTPYFHRTVPMPVAATMGFWESVYDLDAVSQLNAAINARKGNRPVEMTFTKKAMYWRFFPFSGMNCAFRAKFWPDFKFVEGVGRMDDIFMGYRIQRAAYHTYHCINLNGPMVRHVRQSNLWNNLKSEAEFMEEAETRWIEEFWGQT